MTCSWTKNQVTEKVSMTSYGFKVTNICEGGTGRLLRTNNQCPAKSPVLQCEIDLGFSFGPDFSFAAASASYTVVALGADPEGLDDSDVLQHPDDTQPMTSWDMAATDHAGYFSFGTPATIIDGGGKRNCYSGTCALDTEAIKMGGSTAISFTKGPTAPSTVLRFGFCQSFYLEQFRIKDIAAKIWLPAPPTCSDGVQNQGEAGVDCGGPCSWCAHNYKLVITKDHGSGHTCATEMEIKNAAGNIIPATYVSSDSCFGPKIPPSTIYRCTCPTAEHAGDTSSQCAGGGNAQNFFNGVNTDTSSQWWCSEYTPGAFAGASIIFTLEESPAAYSLKRPRAGADSSPKDWTLQHQQADGTWLVISTVTGAAASRSQDVTI
jgi:hypothetical protein